MCAQTKRNRALSLRVRELNRRLCSRLTATTSEMMCTIHSSFQLQPEAFEAQPWLMPQPDFYPAPTTVRIWRCKYVSQCKVRGCLKRANLIAEKTDVAGRHVRQIELCTQHCEVVIESE